MKANFKHDENNENIVCQSKRENAILGRIASVEILKKLNNTLNKLCDLVRNRF